MAVPVLSDELTKNSFALAGAARKAGLRASVYLGSSGKLAGSSSGRRTAERGGASIYGTAEWEACVVTVRDMVSGEQQKVPVDNVVSYLAGASRARAEAADG